MGELFKNLRQKLAMLEGETKKLSEKLIGLHYNTWTIVKQLQLKPKRVLILLNLS
jgi:hypothetical protein